MRRHCGEVSSGLMAGGDVRWGDGVRQDTVRCIVTGLTDDSSSELFQELRRQGGAGIFFYTTCRDM